jgi:hypothetical protein
LIRFSPLRLGQDVGAVPSPRASDLLKQAVRLHGISLGRPVDVLLDRDELRALGFDVLCGDHVHRFLPWPTAVFGEDGIAIQSPLVLFEEDELDFYRARTLGLTSLLGKEVVHGDRTLGLLDDVVIGSSGVLEELIVASDGVERRVPFDARVRLAPGSRTAA